MNGSLKRGCTDDDCDEAVDGNHIYFLHTWTKKKIIPASLKVVGIGSLYTWWREQLKVACGSFGHMKAGGGVHMWQK